jgi:hypothetical protein
VKHWFVVSVIALLAGNDFRPHHIKAVIDFFSASWPFQLIARYVFQVYHYLQPSGLFSMEEGNIFLASLSPNKLMIFS